MESISIPSISSDGEVKRPCSGAGLRILDSDSSASDSNIQILGEEIETEVMLEKVVRKDDIEPNEDIEILPAIAEELAWKRSSSADLLLAREAAGKRQKRPTVVIPPPVVKVVKLDSS